MRSPCYFTKGSDLAGVAQLHHGQDALGPEVRPPRRPSMSSVRVLRAAAPQINQYLALDGEVGAAGASCMCRFSRSPSSTCFPDVIPAANSLFDQGRSRSA